MMSLPRASDGAHGSLARARFGEFESSPCRQGGRAVREPQAGRAISAGPGSTCTMASHAVIEGTGTRSTWVSLSTTTK